MGYVVAHSQNPVEPRTEEDDRMMDQHMAHDVGHTAASLEDVNALRDDPS